MPFGAIKWIAPPRSSARRPRPVPRRDESRGSAGAGSGAPFRLLGRAAGELSPEAGGEGAKALRWEAGGS